MSIEPTIKVHGASAVYKAASRWMGGDTQPLRDMAIDCASMGDAWRIMGVAFDHMAPVERGIDHAQVNAELDAIR